MSLWFDRPSSWGSPQYYHLLNVAGVTHFNVVWISSLAPATSHCRYPSCLRPTMQSARGDRFLLVIKSSAYLALHAFSSHLGEGGKYTLHRKEPAFTIDTGSDQDHKWVVNTLLHWITHSRRNFVTDLHYPELIGRLRPGQGVLFNFPVPRNYSFSRLNIWVACTHR